VSSVMHGVWRASLVVVLSVPIGSGTRPARFEDRVGRIASGTRVP